VFVFDVPAELANAAQSDGESIPGACRANSPDKRLRHRVAKAKKKSNTRTRKALAPRKACARIAQRQSNECRRLTSELVKRRSACIVAENLNILNMARNRRLARAIHERRRGLMPSQLACKAERAGGWLIKADPPNRPQLCSACGCKSDKPIGLSAHACCCERCGHAEDRDVNAAKHALSRGPSLRSGGIAGLARPGVCGAGRKRMRPRRRAHRTASAQCFGAVLYNSQLIYPARWWHHRGHEEAGQAPVASGR